MLPSLHMQAVVLHRRGGRDGVAPGRAEPLDAAAIVGVAGDAPEAVEHVVGALLAQAVEERARVLEHDARLLALADQLRNELAHALVAPQEHRRVVVVADALVLEHVLQVADHLGGAKIASTGGNQRLVHVQCVGEGALDAAKVDAAVCQEDRPACRGGDGALNFLFRAADVGQAVDVFGKVAHVFLTYGGSFRKCSGSAGPASSTSSRSPRLALPACGTHRASRTAYRWPDPGPTPGLRCPSGGRRSRYA